ncbi:hypothetical protein NEOKW01_1902 [Nematocida sp. AWRm80]|nr:hypothetical protein NEOKW01_1902 [Nematocida sp. AWRm80]
MKISYRGAEGLVVLVPMLLTYIFRNKINAIATEYLLYIRIALVLSILIDMGLAYLIKKKIDDAKVGTKIKFTSDDYIQMTKIQKEGEEEEEIEMTLQEYDTQVISTYVTKSMTNALIHIAIHIFTKTSQPLFMLILNPLKSLLFSPIHIEYIRGVSMLRPFSRNVLFEINEPSAQEANTKKGNKQIIEEIVEEPEEDDGAEEDIEEIEVVKKSDKLKKEE